MPSRFGRLLSSLLQPLSTDYPASEPARWTGYKVALPHDAVAPCTSVDAPASCNDAALIEDVGKR